MKMLFHRITKGLYCKALILAILLQGLVVSSVYAGDSDSGGTPNPSGSGTPNPSGGGVTSGSSQNGGSIRFENPLGADSLGGFIDKLLGLIAQLAVPVIAVFIIWAGFLFVTARGNEEQLKRAKKTLLYTVIGAAIILGAQVISSVITGTLLSL